MKLNNMTIQTKILLALTLTFTILLITSALFLNSSQRQLVTDLATEKVDDIANSYFDGVNTMMLTGTTAQRTILKKKMLEAPGVRDVTILRSKNVNDTFGHGIEGEQAESENDNRALKGELFQQMTDTPDGRELTTWIPLKASSDYRGTNCLTCHVVPEGTVLGAVRATYSLQHIDDEVSSSIFTIVGINLALFIAGIVMMVWLLHSLLVKPILNMRKVMNETEETRNLANRLPVHSNDEIGKLAQAINKMLERFQESIKGVIETSKRVTESAHKISSVSEITYNAAFSQLTETNNVATAVTELSASAEEVNNSANRTAEASISANDETGHGRSMTEKAVNGIHGLISEIEHASDVINQLDGRTQGIGHVLDVIRNIAEQTNLLALNAAIEAARAGDSGRGFAVVADEVRTLATRSHESTEEIQDLIEKLQTDAKQAVETMSSARESASERGAQIEAAGNSLNTIASQVAEINALNNQMANAAREQSVVTEDVSKNISTISQIAQATSNDVQQVNDFSQELVQLSNKLNELVEQFTV
jgi:methyl-accepting chemotaxis protein